MRARSVKRAHLCTVCVNKHCERLFATEPPREVEWSLAVVARFDRPICTGRDQGAYGGGVIAEGGVMQCRAAVAAP
jgi:hypothetical protein